eukprot:1161046-Pelagomonas_calceolata.AAC.10
MELNRKERRKGKEGEGGRGREGEERNGKEKKQLYLATSTASLKQKMFCSLTPVCCCVEQTWNVKQTDIAAVVDVGVAQKAFDLRLPDLGPYSLDFTRAGRHLLLGGRYGWGVASPWGMVVCFGSVSVADFMHAGRHLLREGRHGHLPELSVHLFF